GSGMGVPPPRVESVLPRRRFGFGSSSALILPEIVARPVALIGSSRVTRAAGRYREPGTAAILPVASDDRRQSGSSLGVHLMDAEAGGEKPAESGVPMPEAVAGA